MIGAQARTTRLVILLLIFVVAVLAAFLYTSQSMADPDQFWHVATGRWIVEHRQIPTTDPFSWYAKGHHWIAQEWLFGLIAYGVQSVVGWKGLYLFIAMLDGLLVMLVYALSRARGAKPLWAFLIMTASMAGMLWFAVPRPQMVTFCLVLLTALLLEKGKWPWALLCVLIGVNVHGGVWPIYVLVFAFYEFPKRWWLVAAATAVTLVNPNPIGVFTYPFQALSGGIASQLNEFRPTALWERKVDLAFYIGLVVIIHRKRIWWRDAAFALAFVVLSLSAVRHLQWFYVLVLPVMAPYINVDRADARRLLEGLARLPVLRRLPWEKVRGTGEGTLAAADPSSDDGPAPGEAGKATLEDTGAGGPVPGRLARSRIPEILLVGALSLMIVYLGGRAWRQRVDVERYYPREMVPYLRLYKITRFFNVWHEGGYFIYSGIAPMIDGRGDPYVAQKPGDKNMASDYMALNRSSLSMRDFLLRYDIEWAVLPPGPMLTSIRYDPAFRWVKVTQTHVLVRFDPAIAKGGAPQQAATDTVTPSSGGSSAATTAPGASGP